MTTKIEDVDERARNVVDNVVMIVGVVSQNNILMRCSISKIFSSIDLLSNFESSQTRSQDCVHL